MENQFIGLVDVSALAATPRDLSLVYIGMSRARTGLWMAMDSRLESELLDLSEHNLALIEEVSPVRTCRTIRTTPVLPYFSTLNLN